MSVGVLCTAAAAPALTALRTQTCKDSSCDKFSVLVSVSSLHFLIPYFSLCIFELATTLTVLFLSFIFK